MFEENLLCFKNYFNFFTFNIVFCSISNVTYAKEPEKEIAIKQILKIEDFLPKKKKWTISTGINIAQSESSFFYSNVYNYDLDNNNWIYDYRRNCKF